MSVQRLYNQGNEIATHTMTHPIRPSASEIIGAYRAINAFSGVPTKDILGFRTPYLNYGPETFKYVRASGMFLYDSSMTMDPNDAYWPYTLDNGPVNKCFTGECSGDMKFPGLWEIPMYQMMNTDGSINTSMDPNPITGQNPQDVTLPTGQQIFNMWKYNFDRNYNGNRTPFGLYLHTLFIYRPDG
jgi:peptidoglycan/xylan/chitin deacetylase (PgdA/CDA1 family)